MNPAGPPHPWEGPGWCAGITRAGTRCRNREIDGLGYCLQHMPDDLLDEAEWLRGAQRCRVRPGCRQFAVEGTLPAACKNHGANIGSMQYRQAAVRVVEQQVAVAFAETLTMMRVLREHAAGFERANGRPPCPDDYQLIIAAAANDILNG